MFSRKIKKKFFCGNLTLLIIFVVLIEQNFHLYLKTNLKWHDNISIFLLWNFAHSFFFVSEICFDVPSSNNRDRNKNFHRKSIPMLLPVIVFIRLHFKASIDKNGKSIIYIMSMLEYNHTTVVDSFVVFLLSSFLFFIIIGRTFTCTHSYTPCLSRFNKWIGDDAGNNNRKKVNMTSCWELNLFWYIWPWHLLTLREFTIKSYTHSVLNIIFCDLWFPTNFSCVDFSFFSFFFLKCK